ncbi:MAG: DUF29 domain-containing protein [Acetobacteraceae bacterium]|nr:DUF29 domain-containing protein [Acetobacteraceae bacterium]
MSGLYDADVLLWSEQQAELLRRRAANALDWENLAEEIEDVGRSQLNAVESLLTQALLHYLKAECWPVCRRRWTTKPRYRRRNPAHLRWMSCWLKRDPTPTVGHAVR